MDWLESIMLFIINSFLSLDRELKILNGTNEKIVELLKEFKKEQSNKGCIDKGTSLSAVS